MIIKSIDQLIAGRAIVGIAPEATVSEACTLLDAHNIGALAVLDHGRLVGILSERDMIRRCASKGLGAETAKVSDIMTRDPQTIGRNESLAAAQTMMLEGGFRHLPVVDATRAPVGMLSMRDIPTEYRLMVERFREYTAPQVS